jgi:hypothetical protein
MNRRYELRYRESIVAAISGGTSQIQRKAIGATITFRVDGRDAHETVSNQAGPGACVNLSTL